MAKLHAGMVEHETCFFAYEQTQGRGQRGKKWLSSPGENITMSTLFEPTHRLSANVTALPFLLSAAMALGCYDFIKDYGIPDVSIKWPNDLYSGDRKAAGILIDNIYKGTSWEWSVVGTGININQEGFPGDLKKAVSFKMLTGTHYNTVKLGKKLFGYLLNRFELLKHSTAAKIMEEYNSVLYKRKEEIKFKKDTILFTARISHANQYGQLIITGEAGEQAFGVGEVEFI